MENKHINVTRGTATKLVKKIVRKYNKAITPFFINQDANNFYYQVSDIIFAVRKNTKRIECLGIIYPYPVNCIVISFDDKEVLYDVDDFSHIYFNEGVK